MTRSVKEWRRRPVLMGSVAVAAVLAGVVVWRLVSPPAQGPGGPGGFGGMGPGGRVVPVISAQVERKDVPVFLDGLGTVQAFNAVTVRSRVDGELIELGFKEGQDVHKGDLLARIDPRSYEAALGQAQAQKDKDQALLDAAKVDLQRYLGLGNRVAQQTVDTQRSTVKQYEAAVKSDQAAIDSARTNLSYTSIASPIDGRTGIRNLDIGNIVHSSDSTGLVSVVQLQPISVVFTLPQQNLRVLNDEMTRQGSLPVVATEADGKSELDHGKVELIDNQVDQTTGTVKLKATLPNAERHLWPGGFVNMRLQLTTRKDAVVVPTPAVLRGPKGPYVYVIKEDRTVEMRPVVVGLIEGEQSIIDSGVQPEETVVVDGSSKLQPGGKVRTGEGKPQSEAKPQEGAAPPTGAAPPADAPPAEPEHKHRKKNEATDQAPKDKP